MYAACFFCSVQVLLEAPILCPSSCLTFVPCNPGGPLFPCMLSAACNDRPSQSAIYKSKSLVCIVFFFSNYVASMHTTEMSGFHKSPCQMKLSELLRFSPPLLIPLSVQALLSVPRVQKSPLDQHYPVFHGLLQSPEAQNITIHLESQFRNISARKKMQHVQTNFVLIHINHQGLSKVWNSENS